VGELTGCGGGSDQNYSCTDYAKITLGRYWVNNNVWGRDHGSGQSCIWSNCVSGSTIEWGTSWDWSGDGSVMSYVAVILGWHWGWEISNTGLPVQISSGRSVDCGWSFSVSQNGTMNVAYDLWVHNTSNPDYNSDPTAEVMIWLYRAGGAGPISDGNPTSVSLAGADWELHHGRTTLDVHSFVRTSNTTAATFDIMDFLNLLVSRGAGGVSNSSYLSSVQAGTEVFQGSGQLDTNAYYCVVN